MKSTRILSIVTLILFFGVLTVNALANILPINNYNTGELSDLIPNLFVPAGLTFSIWGVIYLLLTILVIYTLVKSFQSSGLVFIKINILLGTNFILNIGWILVWHYRLVFLSLLLMLGILVTLFYLNDQLKNIDKSNFKKVYFLTISIYFGWISVATIANITGLLVTLGWKGYPLNEEIWTIIVLIVGLILAAIMLIKNKNLPFSAVFVWAYIGIIIKRATTAPVLNSIIIVAAISIALLVVISIYLLFRKRNGRLRL